MEFPGASETFADFVNAGGVIVGSYVDADGLYHTYVRDHDGTLISVDFSDTENLEYFFLHGVNDAGALVGRAKTVSGVPVTYIGSLQAGLREEEFKVPGSVSTEGWNINQDGSIVGHYDSVDGRRHGFIAS